jgi:hypothetical protein
MKTVVGIFPSVSAAETAVTHLKETGLPASKINLLVPGEATRDSVVVDDTEQPGVARAIGAVVGGATGAFAGLSIAATLLLPGVGAVTAIGLAAAATLAAAGAVGGAAAGDALEEALQNGLPVDEVYVYEDALRQGRSVLVAEIDGDTDPQLVRSVLIEDGAESIDAAREQWWTGLRSAEEEHYTARGLDFDADEADFRRGFEVAQLPGVRSKSYDEALSYLAERYPDVYDHPAFRRGYERGWTYREEAMKMAQERQRVALHDAETRHQTEQRH